MKTKFMCFFKTSISAWVMVLLILGSCSTIQQAERGTNQRMPGITNVSVKKVRGTVAASNSIEKKLSIIDSVWQMRTKSIEPSADVNIPHGVIEISESKVIQYALKENTLNINDEDATATVQTLKLTDERNVVNRKCRRGGKEFGTRIFNTQKKKVGIQVLNDAIFVKWGILHQLKNIIPEKVHSISKNNSVVPDYYSPVWHWILFIVGLILAVLLFFLILVAISWGGCC